MKTNITMKSAALVALMGLFKVVTAQAEVHSFTPLENLPPEQRQLISEQLNKLTKDLNIDWDEIVVGIDENGKITLVPKSVSGIKPLASPSSFSSRVQNSDECK